MCRTYSRTVKRHWRGKPWGERSTPERPRTWSTMRTKVKCDKLSNLVKCCQLLCFSWTQRPCVESLGCHNQKLNLWRHKSKTIHLYHNIICKNWLLMFFFCDSCSIFVYSKALSSINIDSVFIFCHLIIFCFLISWLELVLPTQTPLSFPVHVN